MRAFEKRTTAFDEGLRVCPESIWNKHSSRCRFLPLSLAGIIGPGF